MCPPPAGIPRSLGAGPLARAVPAVRLDGTCRYRTREPACASRRRPRTGQGGGAPASQVVRRRPARSPTCFTVEPGPVTGFLGPNGAGKTTTLRMLLGLSGPDAGTATFDGATVASLPAPAPTSARCSRRRSTRHGRPRPPAGVLPRRRATAVPRGRGARPGRSGRGRPTACRRLLARHAAAARRLPPRCSATRGAGARRAGQRPGPRGHPVAARLPPHLAHERAARCWSPATCWPRSSRPSTGWSSSERAAWSARPRSSSSARVRTAPAPCSSAAPDADRPRPTILRAAGRRPSPREGRRRARPSPDPPRPRSGSRAFAAGIELHELRAHTSGLEEIYFRA